MLILVNGSANICVSLYNCAVYEVFHYRVALVVAANVGMRFYIRPLQYWGVLTKCNISIILLMII